MKKAGLIILSMMAAWSVCAATGPQECGKLSYLQGKAFSARAGKEANLKAGSKIFPGTVISTKKDSKAIISLKDGTELRLDTGSSLTISGFESGKKAANIGVEALSGRLWIKAVKSGKDSTLSLKTPFATFKIKNAVIDIDTAGFAEVYYGMAILSSKEGRSNLTSGQKMKTGNSQGEGNTEWSQWNQSRDRMSILVESGEGIKADDLRRAFDPMLTPNYAVALVEYEKGRKEVEDFDLVVNVGFGAVEKDEKEGEHIPLNIKISQGFDGAVIDIINEEIASTNGKIEKQPLESALLKDAAKVSKAVTYYAFTTVADSRKVTVDVTGNSEDAREFAAILGKTRGVSGITSKDFYGQKTVYSIKYEGLASDLAEVLSGNTINNKPLNINKNTKNVLKLSIK